YSRIARARSVSPLRWLAGVVAGPAEAQRTDCRRPRWCTRAPVRSGAIPVVRTRPVTTSCVAAWRTQSVSDSSQPEALLSRAAGGRGGVAPPVGLALEPAGGSAQHRRAGEFSALVRYTPELVRGGPAGGGEPVGISQAALGQDAHRPPPPGPDRLGQAGISMH